MAARRSALIYICLIALPLAMSVVGSAVSLGRLSIKAYLKEHFVGTDFGRHLNTIVQNKILNSPNVGNVHIGHADWLFYLPRTDGNSLADFYGIGTAEAASAWSDYLSTSAEKPFGLDAKYLFFVVPNKESIYPDQTRYMFPDMADLSRGNRSRLRSVNQAVLPENHIDIEEILLAGREQGDVYLRSDTHWSSWGSYLVHKAVLEAAGRILNKPLIALPPINAGATLEPGEDLTKMLGKLASVIGYRSSSLPEDYKLQGACCVEQIKYTRDVAVYRNTSKPLVVWIVGDSFREKLIPFLPNYFGLTVFISIRSDTYFEDMKDVLAEHGPPSLVIEERVERYLSIPPKYRRLR